MLLTLQSQFPPANVDSDPTVFVHWHFPRPTKRATVGPSHSSSRTSTSPAAVGDGATAAVSANNSARPRRPFARDVKSLAGFCSGLWALLAADVFVLEYHFAVLLLLLLLRLRSPVLLEGLSTASSAERFAKRYCSRTWIRLNTDSTTRPLPAVVVSASTQCLRLPYCAADVVVADPQYASRCH